MRIAVALSGGVDSSVAAALLVEQGHDVVGVTLQQWPRGDAAELERHGGCCSLNAVEDARRVASLLGIPYYCWNLQAEFGERVIEPFHRAYLAGETPNPCLRCNAFVRFDLMLERVVALGFDRLATGHYARVVAVPHGYELHAAADTGKDQSYVLYHLTQERLARLLFPLGDMESKASTRAEARRLGLPVAEKPESQEICFIPRGRTAEYLSSRLAPRAGDLVTASGQVVGEHRGTPLYTIGQRTGFASLREPGPWYVLRIEPLANRVVVGRREELGASVVALRDIHFIGDEPAGEVECEARLRYRARPVAAAYRSGELVLAEPFAGVAPGQAAVLYRGTHVLGGGTIDHAA